jgi:hypothetical protein
MMTSQIAIYSPSGLENGAIPWPDGARSITKRLRSLPVQTRELVDDYASAAVSSGALEPAPSPTSAAISPSIWLDHHSSIRDRSLRNVDRI